MRYNNFVIPHNVFVNTIVIQHKKQAYYFNDRYICSTHRFF